MSFKYQSIPLEKRKKESETLLTKYPERVPIIVEIDPKGGFPPLDKCKYLPARDMTMGQFVYTIVRRLQIGPEKACFLFINNKLFGTETLIGDIYKTEKQSDGFLYCYIRAEETFGG